MMQVDYQAIFKKIILLFVCLFVVFILNAQKQKAYLLKREGLNNYNLGNYSVSAEYLTKWMKANPNNVNVTVYNALADSYWKQREYLQSLKIYQLLEKISGYAMPVSTRMRIADLYAMQDKYTDASNEIAGIKELEPRKNSFLDINSFIKDSSSWKLFFPSFNTASNEYLPYQYGNNLYLTTNRGTKKKVSQINLATGGQYSGIQAISIDDIVCIDIDKDYLHKRGEINTFDSGYVSKYNQPAVHEGADSRLGALNLLDNLTLDNSSSNIEESRGRLNVISVLSSKTIWNKGSISLSKIKDTVWAYFSGNIFSNLPTIHEINYLPDPQKINKIKHIPTVLYRGILKDDNIIDVQKMDIENFEGSIVHVSVSRDGNLLVFSGKETGKNDYDLFYATRKNKDSWENVQAFGSDVNTIGNEVFPTLQNSGWLYFSSDGLPGLGALDIYKMPFYVNNSINATAKPEHLSYPLNSAFDDFGVTVTDDNNLLKGYFSSNRYGTDDIYAFSQNQPSFILSNGIVKGMQANEEKLLQGATVKLYRLDNDGNRIMIDSISTTDNNAGYRFYLVPNIIYQVTAEKEGWNNEVASTYNFNTKNQYKDISIPVLYLTKPIEKPVVVTEPVVVAKEVVKEKETPKELAKYIDADEKFLQTWEIHHEFDKNEIIVKDRAILDSAVAYYKSNPTAVIKLISTADCYGSIKYNEALAKRRSVYIANKLRKMGVERIAEAKSVGAGERVVGCAEILNKPQTAESIARQTANRYTRILITVKKQ